MKRKQDETDMSQALLELMEADTFAREAEAAMMDIAELDPELCPPDRRYMMPGREAWVYEHDNICELVFVKTD